MNFESAAASISEPAERPRTVSALVLTEWCTQCLLRGKLPIQDAVFTAQSLVQTSLWGIDSHGVARLPHYLTRLAAGSLNPQPHLRFETTGPCTGTLDGDHGLGFVVCRRATDEAITLAKTNGLGFVGVRNSSHCGAIGLYGRMIAEAGLIGLVFTHSDAFVAPHRGHQKFASVPRVRAVRRSASTWRLARPPGI
jgi:ureidoglycolate dehydrogenase (NAD+)